ncbi:MAG: Flp pilus assembly protein CpaB [Bdellovibrionales bacterium]|nr:Flp pilus assembly protein CpaB [Bdellovibrionales bacterium]
MNQNETRTLWISVFAALIAVFLLYSYTQEKSAELNKKFGAKEKVVVATRDINEMETINETMLEIVERPVDFIQPTAINDPELAVGKVALAPIKSDEQILENKIMEPGPITGLSLQVTPGKRAVTIPIDEMRGIAKLIKPGDRVDVIAALDVGKGANQRREVLTLMQDVTILATGIKVINELPRLFEKQGKDEFVRNLRADTTFTNVTVEASPKQAQDLIYILSTSPGSLFMTLRHPSDNKKSKLANSTIESVLRQITTPVINQQLTRNPSSIPVQLPKKQKTKPKKKGPFIDL